MKRVFLILLLCIIVTSAVAATGNERVISIAQSNPSFNWWNPSFVFERNISVTNPYNQPFVMKPVFVDVNFEPGHLTSALKEIRIINGTGYEVPSFIVSENYSGGFVTSAQILFLVNIAANSTQTYQLYYGNPMSPAPSYRTNAVSSLLHSGVLTLTSLGYQQGSNLNISIANTFFFSLYDKTILSTQSSQNQEYGSLLIAPSTYNISKQWRTIGLLPSANFSASELTYFAGQVKVTKVLLAYNGTFDMITHLFNPSGNLITNLSTIQLMDFSQLAVFGVSGVVYNATSNVVYGYVGDTYAGFSTNSTPALVDTGNMQFILNATRLNNLTSNFNSAGPSAAAVSYRLGQLPPSASLTVETVWSVASSISSLSDQISAQFKGLEVSLGNESYVHQYLPNATVLWEAGFNPFNITLPSTGASISLPLRNLNWIPESFSYNGTIFYSMPSPAFSVSSSAWSSKATFSGNASSYASSKFFSTTLNSFTGRVASWVFSPNASSSAMLISSNYSVLDSLGTNLSLYYSADIISSNVSRIAPFAYLAIDVDPTLRGNYSNTLVFPLSGSLIPTNTTTVQNLATDGNWHKLTIPLTDLVNSTSFEFRMRIVASSPSGFVGQVELNFGEAAISWIAQTKNLISATLSSSSPTITINYKPLESSPPFGVLNLHSTFLAVQQLNFTASAGTSFSTITKSFSSNLTMSPYAMMVFSDYYSMNPSIYFNGTKVTAIQQLTPVILVSGAQVPLRQDTNGSLTAIDLNFTGYVFKVAVFDSDGKPVQGVSAFVNPLGYPLNIQLQTDVTGSASVQLLPWTYLVNVYYQGYQLYSVFVGLNGSHTLNINASVYNIIIEAKTQGGKPLSNYPISVSTRNFSIQGMTDINGRFNFPAVANAVYVVNLTQPDGSQISQALRASMNNEIFSITTPYHSAQTQLLIETAVVVIVIVAALALYVFSRRGSAR
ncbi:MAG: hypothetical protein QXV32_03765 [Conexivisphaerales archaeon]